MQDIFETEADGPQPSYPPTSVGQNLAFLACNHSQCIPIFINRWHIRWDTNAYNDRLLVFVDDYHRIFDDD